MRSLKLGLMWILFAAVLGCGVYLGYLGWLTTRGYCHAEGKYLTDEEKIRVALVDLLRKYPPAVVDKTVTAGQGRGRSAPVNPVRYRNVDEFLFLNPDCCKVRSVTYPELDVSPECIGSHDLVDTLMGVATCAIEVTYLVRFKDEHEAVQSIKTTGWLHISNCGNPAKLWTPH